MIVVGKSHAKYHRTIRSKFSASLSRFFFCNYFFEALFCSVNSKFCLLCEAQELFLVKCQGYSFEWKHAVFQCRSIYIKRKKKYLYVRVEYFVMNLFVSLIVGIATIIDMSTHIWYNINVNFR